MNILVVDPKSVLGPKVEPLFGARNWRCSIVPDMSRAINAVIIQSGFD